MARLLALDVGDRTIGVAVADSGTGIAFPVTTLRRQPEGHRRDVADLARLIGEQGAERVVVGLPLNMDGTRGPQAERVERFVAALQREVAVPVAWQDERLSTFEAEEILLASGRPRRRHKETVDAVAASVILRDYMASCATGNAG
ncbi:MAG TPA: Holliday junction resolvase RuvX [Chthonomonadales bacterium]|nr:Holliday junction resolvase RuvX [Chthonomonadales bacterium]